MNNNNNRPPLFVLHDYLVRTTHWQEGGADRHDGLVAMEKVSAAINAALLALTKPTALNTAEATRLLQQVVGSDTQVVDSPGKWHQA